MEVFALPLPRNAPPQGFEYDDRPISELSTTTAFDTGIETRDEKNGVIRCVVCGHGTVQNCHIVTSEKTTWEMLRDYRYIPSGSKSNKHEPRNGLSFCPNHHDAFDHYQCFIRYLPMTRQFVLVNYSDSPDLRQFHGKAVNLDIDHHHAPFPSLFIIHEQRVRGFWPFAEEPDLPDVIQAQDWLLSEPLGLRKSSNVHASRRNYAQTSGGTNTGSSQTANNAGQSAPGKMVLTLDKNTIAQILSAQWELPTWKACVRENMSWEGTAEENIAKYKAEVMT